MKQSWIVGIIALWVIITISCNIAKQEPLMAQTDADSGKTQTETLDTLMKPAITDIQNPLTIIVSVVTKAWDYLKIIVQVAFLYYPEVWQGGAMLIYYVFFLPIGIGFVATIVMIIRGVGSS